MICFFKNLIYLELSRNVTFQKWTCISARYAIHEPPAGLGMTPNSGEFCLNFYYPHFNPEINQRNIKNLI